MDNIVKELETSITKLDAMPICDKFKFISDKNKIINHNLELLQKMETDILNYIPNPIEIDDLENCIKGIEDEFGIFENDTLEDSINKYHNLMNKISGIEKFITQKTVDYSIE